MNLEYEEPITINEWQLMASLCIGEDNKIPVKNY